MDRFKILKGEAPVPSINKVVDLDKFPISPKMELYRAKEGVVDRCGILYWDPKAMFVGSQVHFYNKKYFVCKKGVCCRKLRHPVWRVASPIIKYDTNSFGNVLSSNYKILMWRFGESTFRQLKELGSPLTDYDFRIFCENERYQRIHINPVRGGSSFDRLPSIWQSSEHREHILAEALPLWNEMKSKGMGMNLSEKEIENFLGDVVDIETTGFENTGRHHGRV